MALGNRRLPKPSGMFHDLASFPEQQMGTLTGAAWDPSGKVSFFPLLSKVKARIWVIGSYICTLAEDAECCPLTHIVFFQKPQHGNKRFD